MSSVEDGGSGPVVSIVIVAHDAVSELRRCLASIRDHAGVEVQTILVDNASTDGTADWVRREYPGIELVVLPRNLGVGARGRGLARVRGTYTMFLDSDAALTPGALPAMVDALDRSPTWGLLGPRLVGDDGELQLSARRFPPRSLPLIRRAPLSWLFEGSGVVRRHLMADDDHSRARPVVYVLGACQLFRSSFARDLGPWDEHVFLGPDDIDWCIRVRDAGYEIVYFPEATVRHSYQRRTRRLSVAALRHARAFYAFQWRYRHRSREFAELAERLDRAA